MDARGAVAAIAAHFATATMALAADESAVAPAAAPDAKPPASGWHGRVELKRQNTSRGTDEESTKTTLRLESFFTGPVSLLRLDLQFPDEKTGFSGSPLDPRPGDTKLRLGFKPLRSGPYSLPSFVELTLPTADPESLGAGKVQLSAGLRLLAPVTLPLADPKPHETRFEAELQHTQSVAGDEARNDIRYTKLELTLNDTWRRSYTFKFKLKTSVDWERGGDTGAVGEIEGGVNFAEQWRTWLMLGRRLWGPAGIGGTYDDRLEFGLSRSF